MINLRSIDLNLLTIFSALMREQNISHAAESLGMTQPAVSHALKRLRTLYNDTLFEHKARKMQPTTRARSIAPLVEQILEDIKSTLPVKDDFDPSEVELTFKVNIPDLYNNVLVTEFVRMLEQIAPSIALTVTSEQIAEPANALVNRQFDIHIDFRPIEDERCHHKQLFKEKAYILARKNHTRLAHCKELTIEQFKDEKHAVLIPNNENKHALSVVSRKSLPERKIGFTGSNMRNVFDVVRVTDYLCLIPESQLQALPNVEEFIWFAPPFFIEDLALYMNWYWGVEHYQSHRWLRKLMTDFSSEHMTTVSVS